MTITAIRPRKKATKKKISKKTSKQATTKVAKAPLAKKKKTKKKPKWALVNYKQIEVRRGELSLSKSAMSELLGVTNSTYHNWRRGTTVPHASQQENILAAMHNGPSIVPGETPSATQADKPAKAVKPRRVGTKKKVSAKQVKRVKKVKPSRAERLAAATPDPFGAAFLAAGEETTNTRCGGTEVASPVSRQSSTRRVASKVQTAATVNRRETVASITNSFIQAGKGKASAGQIIQLVEGLQNALH